MPESRKADASAATEKKFDVVAEFLSPLILPREAFRRSIDDVFISGATWRGALAQLELGQSGILGVSVGGRRRSKEFRRLFDTRLGRFGYLYPYYATDDLMVKKDVINAVFPCPLTVWRCDKCCRVKQVNPGSGSAMGWYDTVLYRIRQHTVPAQSGQLVRLMCPAANCGQRLARRRGLVVWEGRPKGKQYRIFTVVAQAMKRLRLSVDARTPEKKGYFREYLVPAANAAGERLVFFGRCTLANEQVEALRNYAARSADARVNRGGFRFQLAIGARRSSGFGKCLLWLRPREETGASVEDRLDAFQRALRRVLSSADAVYASLTFLAPAVLRDERFSPVFVPNDPKMLFRDCAVPPPESLEFVAGASAVGFVRIGGWSMAWQHRKPVQWAVAPGSVWTFRCAKSEKKMLVDFLQHVERVGIGETTHLGEGDVAVCNQVHVHLDYGKY